MPREGDHHGLALGDLRLRFLENVYFAAPGQGWFEWGVSWGRHKGYTNLNDFQTDLPIDFGGRVLDPAFADLIARDYRLDRAAMAGFGRNYPQGPVPGVILGIRP